MWRGTKCRREVPAEKIDHTSVVRGYNRKYGGHGRETRVFLMSNYETCNITVLLIFLTTQTGNSIRPNMQMTKVGEKLEGVTPAPLVLPVTDAKEESYEW